MPGARKVYDNLTNLYKSVRIGSKTGGSDPVASTSRYLSLKQAAQRLGIHEQTLRSWESQGLIRLAHLPKSGYRRVPIEEVERIESEMNGDQSRQAVRILAPRVDKESLARAEKLADSVCAELSELAATTTFDEFMRASRGRTWLP